MLNDELTELTNQAKPNIEPIIDTILFSDNIIRYLHDAANGGKSEYIGYLYDGSQRAIERIDTTTLDEVVSQKYGMAIYVNTNGRVAYKWKIPEIGMVYNSQKLGYALGNEARDALNKLDERIKTELFNDEIVSQLKDVAIHGNNKFLKKFKGGGDVFNYDEKILLRKVFDLYHMVLHIETGIYSEVEYVWGDGLDVSQSCWTHVR